MSDLYLIAHIVRGEPAFDIATPIKIGEEDTWIIPTSGHRAFPYWNKYIGQIDSDNNLCFKGDRDEYIMARPASDWPDHYPINNKKPSEPTQMKLNLEDLDL